MSALVRKKIHSKIYSTGCSICIVVKAYISIIFVKAFFTMFNEFQFNDYKKEQIPKVSHFGATTFTLVMASVWLKIV